MDGTCSLLNEYLNSSQCLSNSGGLEVVLFTSLISTLMDANLRLANPDDYPPDASSLLLDEYDFIVIGAGAAGSVVANRLSEVEEWNVLLLEAGGDPTPTTEVPGLFLALFNTELDWQYTTFRDNYTCLGFKNQQCKWPRGKVLGGCSSINSMMYLRGNKLDYDIWEQLGNSGWNFDDVLPYFKKSEGNRDKEFLEEYSDGIYYHSDNGTQSVELFNKYSFEKYLKKAVKELGYDFLKDINGPNQFGFAHIQGTLINATRCSAAKAFLSPAKDRRNLHVLKHSHAMKINIDPNSKQAYSVNFQTGEGQIMVVNFSKEVIVSGGTVNSPQILMLSGIGPKEHLEDIGIDVIQNLQVGEHLQDHFISFGSVFSVSSDTDSEDPAQANNDALYNYLTKREGPFSTVPTSFTGFIRSNLSEVDRPDLQFHVLYFPANDYSGIQLLFGALGFKDDAGDSIKEIAIEKGILMLVPTLLHPKSIGKILLKSSDPFDKPEIHPRYLSEEIDFKILLEGIDFTTKLMNSKTMQCKGAKREKLFVQECNNLEFDSDCYWRCILKHLGTSVFHPIGTCKMGNSSDPSAVVDPELKVHGVTGIRVVDASIMPETISANINAATIMIGEKGSDLIKGDWLNS